MNADLHGSLRDRALETVSLAALSHLVRPMLGGT